jgi:hypothetical protein
MFRVILNGSDLNRPIYFISAKSLFYFKVDVLFVISQMLPGSKIMFQVFNQDCLGDILKI